MAIERHNQELAALNAVAVTASRSLELASVLTDCLDKTLEVMQVDAGAIILSGDPARPSVPSVASLKSS